ncbi:MAG: sodium:proton antiporter NhaD [Bacteroidota bacterium]
MTTFLILLFVFGYIAIVFEHSININKTASALLTGVLIWTAYAVFTEDKALVSNELSHHLASVSEILFFLLGAMTIVELIDAHQGFKIITDRINSRNPIVLLWVVGLFTFFLSAILDNLTTSIVMVTLLRKIITKKELRMVFAGIVIIAANAGGAWSPIGDVTTTMLWIGGQITSMAIITSLFIPSLVSVAIPLAILSFTLRNEKLGEIEANVSNNFSQKDATIILTFGVASLLFVPIFKTITHLPPYLGILFGLGVVWVVSEILHSEKDDENKKPFTVAHALSKIDTSSILFFLGILLAISALESTHILKNLSSWMDNTIGNQDIIVISIGLASAIIDNVPLVAATMGMYDLASYPTDHRIWEFLAYCAGTGGSILIIGSAAGVAVMGMEKINFIWYFKKFTLITALGYFAGAGIYILLS